MVLILSQFVGRSKEKTGAITSYSPSIDFKYAFHAVSCLLSTGPENMHTNHLLTHSDHYAIKLVLKGIIGYSDYSFEIVIFKSFETNRIFVSF